MSYWKFSTFANYQSTVQIAHMCTSKHVIVVVIREKILSFVNDDHVPMESDADLAYER